MRTFKVDYCQAEAWRRRYKTISGFRELRVRPPSPERTLVELGAHLRCSFEGRVWTLFAAHPPKPSEVNPVRRAPTASAPAVLVSHYYGGGRTP